MKVKLAAHLESLSGRHGSMVFCAGKNGQAYARMRRPLGTGDVSREQQQIQAIESSKPAMLRQKRQAGAARRGPETRPRQPACAAS
jgi:hypothetical protein